MKGIIVNDNDIQIENGTMKIADNRYQTAQLVVNANKGEFKEYPLMGCGTSNIIGGKPDVFWSGETKKQLRDNLIDVKEINITETEIDIIIND